MYLFERQSSGEPTQLLMPLKRPGLGQADARAPEGLLHMNSETHT